MMSTAISNPGRGFTLVELLVVIAIMGVLASHILFVASDMMGGKRGKTKAIINAVASAIQLATAETGGGRSPVEHPLAGSRSMRFKFVTADGGALSSSGIALTGRPRTFYVMNQRIPLVTSKGEQRLLDGEDVYADTRVPLLYGVKRKYISILGAKQAAVTFYVRLPTVDENQLRNAKPGSVTVTPIDDQDPLVSSRLDEFQNPTPDELAKFKDPAVQKGEYLLPLSNRTAIDSVLTSSGMQGELASMGALKHAFMASPPAGYPGTDAERTYIKNPVDIKLNPFSQTAASFRNKIDSTGQTLPLVLFPAQGVNLGGTAADQDETEWQPGRVQAENKWRPYRIPGVAIYDAWDREILVSYIGERLTVMSAGADGVFRWNPGKNKIIDTGPRDTTPKGDDTDARGDNVGAKLEDD